MKIVGIDNYDRGSMSDVVVAENVLKAYGPFLVDQLNRRAGHQGELFFKLVEDDYEPFVYDPNGDG